MNLVYLLPLLSRPDKQQVKNELSQKSINDLIEAIYLLYDETERINRIVQQLRSQPQQLQKAIEEQCQKYDILFKDYQGLFQKYQKLLSDYQEVVGHFENIITQFKNQKTEDFVKTIKSKEEVLNICQNLNLHISYQQEYQKEINQININFQEIQQKGEELVSSIKNLNDADQQQIKNNSDSVAEAEAKKQMRNEKITQLLLQIRQMKEKQNIQIKLLNQIQQISQDGILKEQIKKALDLLQLNQALFKHIEYILPTQQNLISNYEEKAEFYKNKLNKEQKIKEDYLKKMQEYKTNYEKNQSQNDNQITYRENSSSKYTKCLNCCYEVYLQYLKLILNLIGIQNVKQPQQLQQDIQQLKSQLNTQYKDIKQLTELTKNLFDGAMGLANYIEQDNKIQEVLNSWKSFFQYYSDLVKVIPE